MDYTHNALGQPSGVTVTQPGQAAQVLLTSVTYYPFGPAAELEYGDGRRLKRTHNQNYQPGVIEDVGPDGLSLGYEFDPVGNLVKLRKGDQSEPPLRAYAYDTLGRLTETRDGTTNALLQGYTYDATGNRTSKTDAGATQTYTYPITNHRLSQVGATSRSYDAVGNTAAIGGTAKEFVYTAANRMGQVKQGGNAVMNYAYNGKGEQTRRYPTTTSTAQTYASYDEAGHTVGVYDHTGSRIQEVIWLGDLPSGVIDANKLHYVQADHLGTPRNVIDPVAEKSVWAWQLGNEAFGDSAPNQDPDNNGTAFVFDLRLPGQRYDAASGFNQNGNRDYEAGTGRYPASDPVGLLGGIGTYGYALSNPLMLFDPDGLQARPKPSAPPASAPGRFVPPNLPPANDPFYGPRRLRFLGPLLGVCTSPQVVLGTILMSIPGNIGQPDAACSDDPLKKRSECGDEGNSCPPCRTTSGRIVPVRTVGYRPLDVIPDNEMQHGVYGSHHNLFVANQFPYPKCDCFWAKQKNVAKPDELRPDWVPVEPFVNGGP